MVPKPYDVFQNWKDFSKKRSSNVKCHIPFSLFIYFPSLLYSEVIVCIFILILLVWLMNREFEISYRLSYHCSKLSQRDRRKIQTLKNQADWLLHNIIPRLVLSSKKQPKEQALLQLILGSEGTIF